ncbi:hypothetical protein [Alteromonas confluentis]|uniref:Uncharacterized protein n=1 Tax=Alteromonas confluentis TaxID=1656094 RepID=A0A1E7ZBE6_9ALTE|nr:hypothetical protein [Alteromonas confluentis]OFC70820.1 hypothetical protein BFC18_10210 [Alteromonas confluentis]
MTPEEWWKNFALNREIDTSGTFIYNAVRALEEMESFQHSVDTFEVLYGLSVGIERLAKIAIILVEHTSQADIEKLEQSLISHNTLALVERVSSQRELKINAQGKEFLSLLTNFYKKHRYDRFSFSSISNIEKEKFAYLKFLDKHLGSSLSASGDFDPIPNNDRIRKFTGRVVLKIITELYNVIRNEARRLNIYTPEVRGDSKALKVFYGKRLDLIDERYVRKEILLYLISKKAGGNHYELIKSIEALELDQGFMPEYIQALLNDRKVTYVSDQIDDIYFDIDDVKRRIEFLDIIDCAHLSYK